MAATLHLQAHSFPEFDLSFSHLHSAAAEAARTLKNVALFVAAPFIGLVYAMALPFVGLLMLAVIGGRAFAKSVAVRHALVTSRKVVVVAASPLLGLVFAVSLPFVGVAMLARAGYQAARA